MTRSSPKPPPMPPRAAAYLEIAAIRERVFTMMFERAGSAQKAVDEAYIAMKFIEDGDAGSEESRILRNAALPADVPDPARPEDNGEAPAAPEDGVKIGHNHYSKAQIDRFKELWSSPDSTGTEMSQCLGVSWMTVVKVAQRLDLGPRGKRPPFRGIGAVETNAISLDQAIDWFENQADGKPVLPSEKYPGSYELGEGTGAVVTRNALVAEINALRLRTGHEAFTIHLNGA